MAKDVASVATPVAITVKKGSSDKTCTPTADGKTITLAMEAKLIAGDYTVTIKGLESEDLTATVNVAKDETLTSYDIADELVADVNLSTCGTIKYAALNQYGERMVSNDPTVSCSFGTVAAYAGGSSTQKPTVTASATKDGTIFVSDINPVLAIYGTEGTVVLVDGTNGITATKTVKYSAPATATTVEVKGTYNKTKSKFQDITAGDKIDDYELLMTAKDQYGRDVDAATFQARGNSNYKVNISIAGGLTNIDVASRYQWMPRTVDGVDYIAVALDKRSGLDPGTVAVAGEATYTIVNPRKGLLVTDKFAVKDNVILSSLTITAKDGSVYAEQDNEMDFEAIDTNGNTVKDYVTLNDLLDLTQTTKIRLTRNADGTAKMIYKPDSTPYQANTDKASTLETETISYNEKTSANFAVKTYQFTVKQKRVAKSVLGLEADTTLAVSNLSTKPLEISYKKFTYADQYSNSCAWDKCDNLKVITGPAYNNGSNTNPGFAPVATGTSVYIELNGAFDAAGVSGTSLFFDPNPNKTGSANVYVKYFPDAASLTGANRVATNQYYDYRFTVTSYSTKDINASDIKIDSIKSGYNYALGADTTKGVTPTADDVTVVAMIGGVKTTLTKDQYTIVEATNNSISTADYNAGKRSTTATLKVQVTTWDKTNAPISTIVTKDYTVSTGGALDIYKVKGTVTGVATGESLSVGDAVTASGIAAYFNATNKYGDQKDTDVAMNNAVFSDSYAKHVKYTFEMVECAPANKDQYEIVNNGLKDAKITFNAAGDYKVKISVTTADGTTKDVTITYMVR